MSEIPYSISTSTYRFGWIIPVDQPPIRHGILRVMAGKIMSVEPANPSAPVDHEYSHLAALPALVNPHTHLEFSLLERPLGHAGMSFSDWIGEVIRYRQSHGENWAEKKKLAIAQGLRESTASGVGLLGEIATLPLPDQAYVHDSCHVITLMELIGLADARIPELQAIAAQHLKSNLSAGLSPHAPYSVHPDVVRSCAELSAGKKFPVAMHLAETREELELLSQGSGPFRELLDRLGVWNPTAIPPGTTVLDYLQSLAPADRTMVIHGNYLSDAEIEFLAQQRERSTVVFCPRTHRYFGHQHYPLTELLSAGVRVVLGTDSRASNPSLNLWHEVEFAAANYPEIPPQQLLRMVTLDAAYALGQEEHFGVLGPGKRAVAAVVPVSAENSDSLWQELLKGQPRLMNLTG